MKTLEERKAILENELTKQLRKGWRISSRTENGCQLIQDKKRNGCLLVFLFLFLLSSSAIFMHGRRKH